MPSRDPPCSLADSGLYQAAAGKHVNGVCNCAGCADAIVNLVSLCSQTEVVGFWDLVAQPDWLCKSTIDGRVRPRVLLALEARDPISGT